MIQIFAQIKMYMSCDFMAISHIHGILYTAKRMQGIGAPDHFKTINDKMKLK